MRLLLAVLTIVSVMAATPAVAARPCTGALRKTCLTPLFRCFKPKGACQGQLLFLPDGTVRTVQCWANKVRREVDASMAGGTMVFRKANGKACLTGDVRLDESGRGEIRFRRGKKKTWTVTHDDTDDSWSVTCANGATEHYTGADMEGQPATCGSLGDTACTLGACP